MTIESFRIRMWRHLVSLAAVLCLLLGSPSPSLAQHVLRFETTTEGAIVFTGNTLGLSHVPSQNGAGQADSIGTFISADPTSVDDDPAYPTSPFPTGTTSSWTANGSSAVLDLPSNKDVEVLYAELLWGGSWNYQGENVGANLDDAVTLEFEDGATVLVSPDADTDVTLDWDRTSFDVYYYVRSGIVTNFVRDHGPGTYRVLGVPGTQNHTDNSLNAAGWTLAVAYAASGLQSRNMAIWAGAEWVDENDLVDFTVTGFCTPPSQPVNGQALISALEGDANRTDDQFGILAPGNGAFIPLGTDEPGTVNNPVDNFFGSQINDSSGVLDERGSFGEANQDPWAGTNMNGGRQGWDITGVVLSDDQLGTNQTEATLRATSTGDSFLATLVAFAIDVNAPFFDLADAVAVEPDRVDVGDTVTYTITLANSGDAAAANVELQFALPDEVTLLSFELDGAPGDVNGDPVTASTLADGVALGTIESGDTAIVEVQVRVDALPDPPAEAALGVRPRLTYDYVSCAGDPAIATAVTADADVVILAPRLETQLRSNPAVLTRGESGTVSVTIANTGTAEALGATLAVPVPSAVDYAAGSTTLNAASVPDAGGSMPFSSAAAIHSSGQPGGTVAAGEQAVVSFRISVPDDAPDSVTVVATVDPDGVGLAPSATTELEISITGDVVACGNGRVESGETCDDGNLDAGDGCSDSCRIEPGWLCDGEPSDCAPVATPDPDEPVEAVPDAGPDVPDTSEPDLPAPDRAPDVDDSQPDDDGTSVSGAEACGCGSAPGRGDFGWLLLLAAGVLGATARRRRAS